MPKKVDKVTSGEGTKPELTNIKHEETRKRIAELAEERRKNK